jgi:hypothetical protein
MLLTKDVKSDIRAAQKIRLPLWAVFLIGKQTARLVHDLSIRRMPQLLQGLDDFARARTGTVAGAKAPYEEAVAAGGYDQATPDWRPDAVQGHLQRKGRHRQD